jgi:hypothetical protein
VRSIFCVATTFPSTFSVPVPLRLEGQLSEAQAVILAVELDSVWWKRAQKGGH